MGEEEAELGDADAAGVGEEEEDGFARGVVPGAAAVGPQAVGDPRVEGRGHCGDELRGVGVSGEDTERPVLEEVEQPGVDDEGGGTDEPELDEFAHPGEEPLGEAQGRGRGRFLVHLSAGAGLSEGRGRGRFLVHLSAGAGMSEGRGGGRFLVDASWNSGLGTRSGRVRERRGFECRGRGLKHWGRGGERGGSARGSLFVVHSPSVARSPDRLFRHIPIPPQISHAIPFLSFPPTAHKPQNSNDLISRFERHARELHARFLGKHAGSDLGQTWAVGRPRVSVLPRRPRPHHKSHRHRTTPQATPPPRPAIIPGCIRHHPDPPSSQAASGTAPLRRPRPGPRPGLARL